MGRTSGRQKNIKLSNCVIEQLNKPAKVNTIKFELVFQKWYTVTHICYFYYYFQDFWYYFDLTMENIYNIYSFVIKSFETCS